MIGYVFKTTNVVTGSSYIGKHLSVKFDPNYYGDGEDLKKDIAEHGYDNFKVEMLRPCESIQDVDKAFAYFNKQAKPKRKKKADLGLDEL